MNNKLKNESGISLMILVITVILMMILTFAVVVNFEQYGEQVKLSNFTSDITKLNEEISQYYSRHKEIPIANSYTNTNSIAEVKNVNDGAEYYVIDLEALNLNLHFGKDYYDIKKNSDPVTNTDSDVYIVNKQSHTVYYPKGIEIDGKTYYKLAEDYIEVGGHTEVILDPNISISTMQNSPDYLFAVKAVVQVSDMDVSNMDLSKSKYVFTEDSSDINDASEYTGGNLTGANTTIQEALPAGTWYLHVNVVDKSGKSTKATSSTSVTIAETADFDYYEENGQGKEQTASLLPGNYKLETWGAEGGYYDADATQGYGGYSVGTISLEESLDLFINVGGKGDNFSITGIAYGGYNGGGNGGVTAQSYDPQGGSGGGGATHIATETGVLSDFIYSRDSLLIVSGGGGGWGCENENFYTLGGSGGGIWGADGGYHNSYPQYYASGARQNQGGYDHGDGGVAASFGQGGDFCVVKYGGNGGGGGFYGGGGSSRSHSGGGGGSGYIGNSLLTNKKMVMYETDTEYVESSNEDEITEITTNVSATATSNYAKKGNGYARITNLNTIKISGSHLIAYYDYRDYTLNATKWNNKLSDKYGISFTGTPTIETDGGLKVDKKDSNVYGTINLEDKKSSDLTIYMIVKSAIETGINPRIVEMPKYPTGGQNLTTPCCYICYTNLIGYSTFTRDVTTSIVGTDYNVLAMKLDYTNQNANGAGSLSFFINGEKCEDVLDYDGRGNILYLSECTYESYGYGNNTFGMLAIYDEAQTDAEIIENMGILANQYIE